MKKIITLAALALGMAQAAQADVIVNGNFEAGLSGWQASGVMGLASPVYFGGGSAADNGTYMAVFNQGEQPGSGKLWQSFGTVAGHTYHVVFDYGTNNGNWQTMGASVTASDASVLGGLDASAPGGILSHFGFDFTAIDSLTTLTFTDNPNNWTYSTDGLLDNIAVTDLNAVPEPGSLVLLSLGLAGLGALRRRQR